MLGVSCAINDLIILNLTTQQHKERKTYSCSETQQNRPNIHKYIGTNPALYTHTTISTSPVSHTCSTLLAERAATRENHSSKVPSRHDDARGTPRQPISLVRGGQKACWLPPSWRLPNHATPHPPCAYPGPTHPAVPAHCTATTSESAFSSDDRTLFCDGPEEK